MAELDYKKFIESIYRQSSKDGWFQSAYRNAIKEQGFSCDEMTGEIVETIMPFKIEKGKWYMCINQYMNCIEGRVYHAISDGRIIDHFGTEYSLCNEADNYFRPATDKEIEEISGNQGKISPKFKVGDWIVDKDDHKIFMVNKVLSHTYVLISNDDSEDYYIPFYTVDEDYRLWTINEAKDGDVLVDEDINVIGIFEGIEGMFWHSKLYYSSFTKKLYGIECGGSHLKEFAKPATKEQRNTLEKAITNAGYSWDADKKRIRSCIIDKKKVTKF